MNYTVSQTQAITADRPEVLVSAAAGSGKTRVVTERVELLVRGADMETFRREQRKTTDAGRMEDIRRMLLVTFTRTAASEMRTRIVTALGDAARSESDPAAAEKLREQAELAAGADITTLHGFCRRVIAEHYEIAGVAAGFTLLNEAQAAFMRNAVVRELFDELYEQRSEDALRLLSRYGAAGDDAELLKLVMDLYNRMMGNVDPQRWLAAALRQARQDPEAYLDSLYLEQRGKALRRLGDLHAVLAQMTAAEASGPMALCETRRTDEKALEEVESWMAELRAGRVPTVPAQGFITVKRGEGADMAPSKNQRKKARTICGEVAEMLAAPDREADFADIAYTHRDLRALIRIVNRFSRRYAERKAAGNRLDFSDLEHRALRVLRVRGASYAERYRYVFVDEYQDTNPVQEAILSAIHLGEDGEPRNRQFLVGDMKQSIYGFRFADPTIFDGKSRSYGLPEHSGRSQLIRMNDNFRSSPAVVAGVNAVMGELMDENLGDVPYTDDEALVCGRSQEGTAGRCRILLAEKAGETQIGEDGEEMPDPVAQADMIAARIAEMHAAGRDYGDIAVLFRSRDDRLVQLIRALESRGIPAAVPRGGTELYVEIEVFLNLLRLVVNDRQDVPLLSVLRSFMFGLDERELGWIAEWEGPVRRSDRTRPAFFQRLERFRQEADSTEVPPESRELHAAVRSKIARFDRELAALRAEGADMSLDRFAEAAADRFSLPSHLLTRPNGTARRRMYGQLLDVIREMKVLHGNSLLRVLEAVDTLQAQGKLFGGSDKSVTTPGVVRLMTVHGSKGLEFPVVFLAGLERKFRTLTTPTGALMSDRFGLTLRYSDPASHVRRDTLETAVVKEHLAGRQRSEELRLLYVAMTRARDELYLCGTSSDPQSDAAQWERVRENRQAAASPLDWVMGAWLALEQKGDPAAAMLIPQETSSRLPEEPGTPAQPFDWETFVEQISQVRQQPLLRTLPPRVRIAAQQGVSRLSEKHEPEKRAQRRSVRAPLIRPVADQDADITGAQRGTLMHRFLRYAVTRGLPAAETLAAMRASCLVSPEEAEELGGSLGRLERFLDSELYRRARRSSKVLAEQRFRLLVDAAEVDPAAPPDAGKVRLRGVIDLAFLEEDGWVLVDYKTDAAEDEDLLADRYREQLGHYSRALREITGVPVKEQYLYLLTPGRPLRLDPAPLS